MTKVNKEGVKELIDILATALEKVIGSRLERIVEELHNVNSNLNNLDETLNALLPGGSTGEALENVQGSLDDLYSLIAEFIPIVSDLTPENKHDSHTNEIDEQSEDPIKDTTDRDREVKKIRMIVDFVDLIRAYPHSKISANEYIRETTLLEGSIFDPEKKMGSVCFDGGFAYIYARDLYHLVLGSSPYKMQDVLLELEKEGICEEGTSEIRHRVYRFSIDAINKFLEKIDLHSKMLDRDY